MALKWLDGFESYGVTNGNNTTGLQKKYGGSNAADSSFTLKAGRFNSGHSVQLAGFATFETPDFTAQDTWIIGFAYKQDKFTQGSTNGSSGQEVLDIKDSTTVQCSLTVDADGQFRFYRGTASFLLGTTTIPGGMRPGVWYYVEIKVKINNTTGTVDIRVNGVSVLSLSSQNTRSGSNNQATRFRHIGNLNSNDHQYLDDFYICDNQGSNNNTFLGHQKVALLLPSGDSGTNQWTTSSGSNHYDRVNENPHNSSTTYVQDTVSGDVDLWDYDNTSNIASILGVQQNTVFETTDASAFSVIQRCKSGATTSDDSGTAGTNGTFTTATRVLETDPNTSALWTTSNLDSAQFGVKVA